MGVISSCIVLFCLFLGQNPNQTELPGPDCEILGIARIFPENTDGRKTCS